MDVKFEEPIITIAVHPFEQNVLGIGFISGKIACYKWNRNARSESELKSLWTTKLKNSVRQIQFSNDGNLLYSISKNRAVCVYDFKTGKRVRCIRKGHEAEPTCLYVFPQSCPILNQQTLTGDEDGQVVFAKPDFNGEMRRFYKILHEKTPKFTWDLPFYNV